MDTEQLTWLLLLLTKCFSSGECNVPILHQGSES